MTPDIVISTRELDSRINDGLQVKLLWCQHDNRVWVAVFDLRTGESFRLDVRDGERPRDVFEHPYAYAACHHVGTDARSVQPESPTPLVSWRP